MSIPQFNKRGTLSKGIHQCNSSEFIDRFCYGEKTIRSKYKEVLEQLFAFSLSRGSKSIIIGGSFITSKEEPNDIDCMVVLPNEKCCTIQSNELLCVEGCEIDVLFIAESSKDTIYSFLNLFSKDKYDIEVGMIEIILDEEKDKSTWSDYEDYYSFENLLKAREAYIWRYVIRGVKEKKILVTIMNLKEYLLFNYHISPLVSAAGWIFAPYVYLGQNILEDYKQFKEYITELYYIYETEISVFADGLGTFLLGKYLKDDLKFQKASFDKIILSNALLSSNFDWIQEAGKVNLIINLKDISNKATISEKIDKTINQDPLFGTAYKTGFKNINSNIFETNYDYEGCMNYFKFQNSIFPMYHMSSVIKENIDKICWENISDILSKDVSLNEITYNSYK
ncbi:DUF6932 family protein [Alkaliphilus oremlandii]|uniref:Uncharacterized protein n=1 Tax=Alkaliphilus oremlandii (strain OhILAs) TaxID=350688 RepID=A8MI33_ALKOO|nr:hypothetical protein [Alkaliphilus oremlandii]ABW19465.1 hypothetical protein Clos_1925 [Alkaliphilus oremlandii OhILAs]